MQADATQTSEAPGKRRRLGVIVRVLIYVPLLGFFGWQAAKRYQDERRAADDSFRASVQQWLEHPPRTIVMPNGELMPVFELTEDEAIEMGLLPESEAKSAPVPKPQPAPQPETQPAPQPEPQPAPQPPPSP